MKKKSIIILVILAVGILVIGMILVMSGRGEKTTSAPIPFETEETVEVEQGSEREEFEPGPADLSKSEEICVELAAHYMWWSYWTLTKYDVIEATALLEKIDKLEQQYRISDEYYNEICNIKVGDPTFMDQVAKRMQELGFVAE